MPCHYRNFYLLVKVISPYVGKITDILWSDFERMYTSMSYLPY